MKTKILLLSFIALFCLQGWASPVDSLKTQLFGISNNKLKAVELTELSALQNTSNVFNGKGSTTLNGIKDEALPFVKEILERIIPVIWFKEVDENVTFEGTTVGTTITKKYQVWGHNTNSIFFDKIKIFLYDNNNQFPCGVFSIDKEYLDASSIDLDEGGHRDTLTVSYSPTEVGEHSYRLVFRAVANDRFKYDTSIGAYYTCMTLPDKADINGSAVERTITTNESSLSFFNAPIGETSTEHFTVYGINLTGPLNLSLSGANLEMFSVYPKTISAEQASAGAEITVNYLPTTAGSHNAKVIISGGDAYPVKNVDLIGSTGNPSFTVNPSSLSFPNMKIGNKETRSFRIQGTNLTGPLSLVVELTGANGIFTIDKHEISAAQVAEGVSVTVTCDPTEAGSLSGRISISGGSAGNKKVTLSGSVLPDAAKVTPSSWAFSNVVVGEYDTKSFTIQGYGFNSDLSLAITGSNVFSLSQEVISPEQAASGHSITVTYRPCEVGTQTAKVTISGGGATEISTINLTGTAIIREIKTEPAALTFSKKTVGKPETNTFKVTGTNLTGPLTVKLNDNTGMYSLNNNKTSITITAEEAANGANVTVNYEPTVAGSHVASISIYGGGAPEDKTVSLIGSAVVREITTTSSSLNFGKVAKGKSKTKKFTVKGTNLTGPLTLEVTGTNKSLFTITPSSITAAQAASGVEVSVTYKPTAKGSHTAKITISGGDALSDKTVDLTGQCVEPKITVSKETIDFGNMDAGSSKTLSFTVTGTDLTEGISLLVASTDSHADFSITPTSLGSNANGATVKVTCTANVAGSISGCVTISSKDAVSKTVDLTGSVKCYITTSKPGLNFSPGKTKLTFTVTCVGANDKLTLNKIGNDPTYFTVTPSTIYKADAQDGKTVTVECIPKTRDRLSAKIKITGGGADDPKYVTLSYSDGSVSINSVDPEDEVNGDENEFTNGSQDAYGNPLSNVYELLMGAKVYAEGLNVIIETPIEQKALISDVAGHIREVNLQNGRNEIPVNASGIYIVRIREKTTKLMLK